jgi:hypothetical protein
MKLAIPVGLFLVLGLGAAQAQAQSCSSFVVITAYDPANQTIEVSHERGSESSYFPRPEGAPTDTTKIPKKCPSKVRRSTTLEVKPTGGRLTVTQVRSNFEGRMLNDTEDPAWLPAQLEKLIADKEPVVAVLRPGKKKTDPVSVTTLYLPITDAEKAEIARIDAQAEDVE